MVFTFCISLTLSLAPTNAHLVNAQAAAVCWPALARAQGALAAHAAAFDVAWRHVQPSQLALAAALAAACMLLLALQAFRLWGRAQEDGGLLPALFQQLRKLPPVAARLRAEKEKVRGGFALAQVPALGQVCEEGRQATCRACAC